MAGPRPAGAQHAQRLPEDFVPAFHPACSGAENHRRTNYSHRLAERGVCVQRGVPGLRALPRHRAEPPPHGVPRGRGGAAAHHVGGGHVHERDGLSAAVPVANFLYAAGHAGRAQGSGGLVRGGGRVVLSALSK